MRHILTLWIPIFFITFSTISTAQVGEVQKDIPALLETYNKRSVPYLSVQDLKMDYDQYVILDTRKKKEFEVSHLPGALWVGEKYSSKRMPKLAKDRKIVVYCSVGIRSEIFGEKMLKDGYTDVRNLYGSIFSWKDAGYEVMDVNEIPTDNVHVYSKVWGRFLKSGVQVF
ncbi:rhodanese-like domain-containing protein [uncultured Nonlabens sp.]|uniref:rhodanese-like domain-containing protein n=1 Tax=uncultured Nonlabens sp. TaxID=859306 RepID=UPI00261C2035|nr:rhodanese-like domain-containing protein [uncultured Nonlabens sp.]